MSTSIIELQREIFLRALSHVGSDGADKWKMLVCDRDSRILLYNVATHDEVLNANIIDVVNLEERREAQPETKAIYLLSPLPHIVDWLRADLHRKRYLKAYVIWTSPLRPDLGASLRPEAGKQQIEQSITLNIEFFPRESHLITFRDPASFQVLFNRHCDTLIKRQLDTLTQKIVSVCVSLGEYPMVRYYRPRNPTHDAAVLCGHLAKFVQDGLDDYAKSARGDFPPPSTRPRATLLITDRSMDLMAPLVHELTYQAMAMDLLPMHEVGDKITYHNVIRRGQPDQEEKDVELNEKDKIWVENRHLHMKDLLVKLSDDFRKFQAKNPQFAETEGQNISVNTIKDMLAGLPEFQEGKEAFSLHIDMAEKCAKLFQDQKLLDVTSVEQSLATGLDEDNNSPRNLADQLVRMLDDESVVPDNRARLLIMYVLYRGGILQGDIEKLRRHGDLPEVYGKMIYNLESLGAKVWRPLRDPSPIYEPLYLSRKVNYAPGDEISLSRFEPILRYALEEICRGNLDNNKFPPTRPYPDSQGQQAGSQANSAQTSLRSAGKPTWASSRPSANKQRQRIIVFVAGGATYSEARLCYELSQQMGKEIFLSTTHMFTPKMFLREVSRLDLSRKELRLPLDERPPAVPSWMNDSQPGAARPQIPPQSSSERRRPPTSGAPAGRPPTDAMQNMNLGPPRPSNGSSRPGSSQTATPPTTPSSISTQIEQSSGKLKKDKDKDKKDKKHLGLFRKH